MKENTCSTTPPSRDYELFDCRAMAQGLLDQREQPDYASLSFEERLGLLVDARTAAAPEPPARASPEGRQASSPRRVEDVDFAQPRGLDKTTFFSLVELALGRAPPRRDHRRTDRRRQDVPCLRTRPRRDPPRAHRALRASAAPVRRSRRRRADGRLARVMAALARNDILILDDFLLRPLNDDQAADLLEVVEDRRGASTIAPPTTRRPLARGTRRRHGRRRHHGPAAAAHAPNRTLGSISATRKTHRDRNREVNKMICSTMTRKEVS